MQTRDKEEIRQAVRESYGKVARGGTISPITVPETSCCGQSGTAGGKASTASCCGSPEITSQQLSTLMGYSKEDIDSAPEGSNMGLGCGNPVALASLKPGETVVDLGSGGGFDCFLAARQVGNTGKVIGVDMTPDMVSKARMNAEKMGTEYGRISIG